MTGSELRAAAVGMDVDGREMCIRDSNYIGDEPDSAITTAFDATLAKDPNDSVVASADGLYEPSVSLTQVQDILVAQPNLNVIVGADQNCEGAQSALTAVKNTSVKLVCYGGCLLYTSRCV